jgi:hypothetical protein
MIEVELHESPEGPGDYQVVATLQVADDGTYRLDNPDGKLLTQLHVLVPDDAGEHGLLKVTLEEDPATWARNLDSIYRGGYLTAVVIRDDAQEATV